MEERIIVAKNAIAIIVVYFYLLVILFFSHCKDRPYSRTLQLFSPLFGSVIATPLAYSDKYWEHPLFLSRRINFCSFFCKVLYFKTKWSVCERRRSISGRMLFAYEHWCIIS